MTKRELFENLLDAWNEYYWETRNSHREADYQLYLTLPAFMDWLSQKLNTNWGDDN